MDTVLGGAGWEDVGGIHLWDKRQHEQGCVRRVPYAHVTNFELTLTYWEKEVHLLQKVSRQFGLHDYRKIYEKRCHFGRVGASILNFHNLPSHHPHIIDTAAHKDYKWHPPIAELRIFKRACTDTLWTKYAWGNISNTEVVIVPAKVFYDACCPTDQMLKVHLEEYIMSVPPPSVYEFQQTIGLLVQYANNNACTNIADCIPEIPFLRVTCYLVSFPLDTWTR